MIRVYRVGMWWGEVEDPGVQSGNEAEDPGGVGMWWGGRGSGCTEWECGGVR